MKVLYNNGTDKSKTLKRLIENHIFGDYVYDYPPRQAYGEIKGDAECLICDSLESDEGIDLYFHFPFCSQKCAFCNLFTVTSLDERQYEIYFDAIQRNLLYYRDALKGKLVRTLYLGGGTPSWIPVGYFENLFSEISLLFSTDVKNIREVSLEMSPECADESRMNSYHRIGINRVNVGVQSFAENELGTIGRKYGRKGILRYVDSIMRTGFENVCIDLIYGLPEQTMDSWIDSLNIAIQFHPETICTYPLTLRPGTGFANRKSAEPYDEYQYQRYETAKEMLLSSGYEQQTHVRYIRKNSAGGYIQKENHWKQKNILGFGAGARSYLKNINFRNGYSNRYSRKVYENYVLSMLKGEPGIIDGFIMNSEEQARKTMVLGLDGLNVADFRQKMDLDPFDMFSEELRILMENDFLINRDGAMFFTDAGWKYRDLIAQMFFSDEVNQKLVSFDYNE